MPTTTESITDTSAQQRAALRWLLVPTFTLFTAIASQIAIPTQPLGVPITLQSLAVVLCALALGPKLGAASMLLYIITGAMGVAVFGEGQSGIATILGQTGGYILGFLIAQPAAHLIIRRRDKTIRGWGAILTASIVVHLVIFAIGVPWLFAVRNLDPDTDPISIASAIHYGFTVFVPGMILKSIIATLIALWALPYIAHRVW